MVSRTLRGGRTPLPPSLQLRRSLLGEAIPLWQPASTIWQDSIESQGRYEEAEPLYLQALQLRRSLPRREPSLDVATSLNNLAELYLRSRTLRGGRTPLSASFAIVWRSLLGESHPSVATSLNNLAALYASIKDATSRRRTPLSGASLSNPISKCREHRPSPLTSDDAAEFGIS